MLLLLVICLPAWTAPPITLQPGDSLNLTLVDPAAPYAITVKPVPAVHNWFAGAFTNLPTDAPVTIEVAMAGTETPANPGGVRKWQGLLPVVTGADPAAYATYEWFSKNVEGQWLSGDPLKRGPERDAGQGTTPRQTAVPAEQAGAYLSADGRYWSAWREIETCEALPARQAFRMTHRFATPTATVAMRVPCTPTYLQAFTSRLIEAKRPGVFVDTLGATPDGRSLQVIRLEDPALAPADDRQTILVIGGEHATEHAASWAALGMLFHLLEETPRATALRAGRTWLFVPMQDPDGQARGLFNRMTDAWCDIHDPATPPEMFAYARYFSDYVYAGHSLDLTVSLHNLEANEGPHLISPLADMRYQAAALAGNRAVMHAARQQGFHIGDPDKPWSTGFMTFRLYAWAALTYGALDLAFEVNDRYPARRLSLMQLQQLGAAMAQGIGDWCAGDDGRQWHAQAQAFMAKRMAERTEYYRKKRGGLAKREDFELIYRGY